MEVSLAYAQRTTFTTTPDKAELDMASNLSRGPVSFRGVVKHPVLMRQLLTALHRVIVDDARVNWASFWLLDPVITVHPDQVLFEAFSTDESTYARLAAPLDAFESAGSVSYGTTNIDFTWQLRNALQHMRSSRQTTFGVGAEGFSVTTAVSARQESHFERKVDLPDTWLKGFLQVQGALAMHPFIFDARPVDLLTIIHYFLDHRAKRPPHGMRYVFTPGEPIQVVLEPWEETFILKETDYQGYERTLRVWGRQRLELLLGILPYAQRVTVGVLGRGLPHFYQCHCGPYTFTLVLSGWVRNDWSGGSAFDLLAPPGFPDEDLVDIVYEALGQRLTMTRREIVDQTMLPPDDVEHALFELCRAGRVMLDPGTGVFRLRELFPEPLDTRTLFGGGERVSAAHALVDGEKVSLTTLLRPGTNPYRRNEFRAEGEVDDNGQLFKTVAAVDREGRLRFGQCTCDFFQEHIMSRGPCEHILAARLALDARLRAEATVKHDVDIKV